MTEGEPKPVAPIMQEAVCLQCERTLQPGEERRTTDEGVFCTGCYAQLRAQVEAALARQGEDIHWFNAAIGAIGGGVLGGLIWWGFTVMTNISFGLVAVVIGFLVGKGVLLLTGGKRAVGLQILSVVVSLASYLYAAYMVNRTYIQRAIAEDPELAGYIGPPLLPEPAMFFEVVRVGFSFIDVLFIAFVIWQAWKMPAPVKLAAR